MILQMLWIKTPAYVCTAALALLVVAGAWSRDAENVARIGGGARFMGAPVGRTKATLPRERTGPVAPQSESLAILPLVQLIELEMNARAGEYPAATPVGLKVLASQAEWRLRVKATDLTLDGQNTVDPIPAHEIYARLGSGAPSSLGTSVSLVEGGPAGESRVEFSLLIVSAEYHRPGDYHGELYVLVIPADKQDGQVVRIPIKVTVQARVEHLINGNKVYFHFGNCNGSQSAEISGKLSADMPVALVLSTAEGCVSAMPRVKSTARSSGGDSASIPVQWQLKLNHSESAQAPDGPANEGASLSWVLNSAPGDFEYVLECKLNPEAYQPPGDYAFEVLVNLVPVF